MDEVLSKLDTQLKVLAYYHTLQSHFLNFTSPQISVILDGAISMDSAIWRVKNASIGQQLLPNVVRKTRSLLMWPTMRKTFTFNVVITEKNPGWAWMTSSQRETLLGRIAVRGTFQIGRRISQITLMKRTACMLSVWNTTMNGMMWIVVTVISTPARKVGRIYKGIAFFSSCSEFSVVTVSSRRFCLCLMVRTFLKFWLKTHRKKASWPVWYTYGILRQLILHL